MSLCASDPLAGWPMCFANKLAVVVRSLPPHLEIMHGHSRRESCMPAASTTYSQQRGNQL
eukprot:7254309-Alexandrium_andersonii.AAC.1